MNITEAIWRNCAAFPEQPALIFEGNPVTYAQLQQTVHLVSARLAEAGIRRGHVVALGMRSPAAYVAALLALARMGAVATPHVAAWPEERKRTLLERHAVHTLVHDAEDSWRADGATWSHLDAGGLFQADPGERVTVPAMAEDVDQDPWMIAVSSGTTGMPKSVGLTHQRGMLDMALNHRGGQRVLVFSSLHIAVGLTFLLRALVHGATAVICHDYSAENFFRMAQRDQPTRVFTTTGLVARLVAYGAERNLNARQACESVAVIQVAGSVLSPGLRKGIHERICPRIEVDYGSTETAALALLTEEDATLHPQSHGRMYPWVQCRAVDEKGQPLPPGEEGWLCFKTPLLAAGYVGDAEATQKAFQHGMYIPGDRGTVDAGGYVFLTGRADHILNIGGVKVNPERVEEVLNSHPAVLESAVVAIRKSADDVPMLVGVVVPQRPIQGEEVLELKKLCAERLGRIYQAIQIVVAHDLPKNSGGKIMRANLAASLRFGAGNAPTQ